MSDKFFTIKNGENIIVEVKSSIVTALAQTKVVPKGTVSSRREDEFDARRTKSGDIEFFHLGYLKSGGGYTDNVALRFNGNQVSAGLIAYKAELDVSPLGDVSLPFLDVPLSYYEDRDAEILARTLSNYKNLSDLIEEFEGNEANFPFQGVIQVYSVEGDYNYVNSNVSTDPDLAAKWKKSSGLKLTGDELSTLEYIGIGNSRGIVFNGDNPNKITSEYDYDADPVEFTPSGKMQFYIMPRIVQSQAFSRQHLFSGDVSQDIHAGNYVSTEPMDYSFNQLNAAYPNGYGGLFVRAKSGYSTQADYDAAIHTLQHSGDYGFDGASVINTLFPPAGSDPYAFNPAGYPERLTMQLEFRAEPEGSLLAVIKQNGNTLYVWN